MAAQTSRAGKSGFTRVDWGILLAGLTLVVTVGVLMPCFVRPKVVSSRSACVANLKQIEGAKATWALEEKKLPTDMPTDADLFGETRYIREKLTCPHGGTYTLGRVGEKPSCTHTLLWPEKGSVRAPACRSKEPDCMHTL